MTESLRRHRLWTTVGLALPVFAGGWLAVLLGAKDYVPWLTSPAFVAGLCVTLIGGAVLVRGGVAHSRQVAEAVVLGVIGFGLSLLLILLRGGPFDP